MSAKDTPRFLIQEFADNVATEKSARAVKRRRSSSRSPGHGSLSEVPKDPGSKSPAFKRRKSAVIQENLDADLTARHMIHGLLETEDTEEPFVRSKKRISGLPPPSSTKVRKSRRLSSLGIPQTLDISVQRSTPRTAIQGFLEQGYEETPAHRSAKENNSSTQFTLGDIPTNDISFYPLQGSFREKRYSKDGKKAKKERQRIPIHITGDTESSLDEDYDAESTDSLMTTEDLKTYRGTSQHDVSDTSVKDETPEESPMKTKKSKKLTPRKMSITSSLRKSSHASVRESLSDSNISMRKSLKNTYSLDYPEMSPRKQSLRNSSRVGDSLSDPNISTRKSVRNISFDSSDGAPMKTVSSNKLSPSQKKRTSLKNASRAAESPLDPNISTRRSLRNILFDSSDTSSMKQSPRKQSFRNASHAAESLSNPNISTRKSVRNITLDSSDTSSTKLSPRKQSLTNASYAAESLLNPNISTRKSVGNVTFDSSDGQPASPKQSFRNVSQSSDSEIPSLSNISVQRSHRELSSLASPLEKSGRPRKDRSLVSPVAESDISQREDNSESIASLEHPQHATQKNQEGSERRSVDPLKRSSHVRHLSGRDFIENIDNEDESTGKHTQSVAVKDTVSNTSISLSRHVYHGVMSELVPSPRTTSRLNKLKEKSEIHSPKKRRPSSNRSIGNASVSMHGELDLVPSPRTIFHGRSQDGDRTDPGKGHGKSSHSGVDISNTFTDRSVHTPGNRRSLSRKEIHDGVEMESNGGTKSPPSNTADFGDEDNSDVGSYAVNPDESPDESIIPMIPGTKRMVYTPLNVPVLKEKKSTVVKPGTHQTMITSTPKPPQTNKKKAAVAAKAKSKPQPKKNTGSFSTSIVKGLFSHFLPGKMSKDAIQEVEKASNQFWENAASDLESFASHAHRKTIDESDVELLMKRQKFVTAKGSLYTLVEKYLPLELRQELIPMCRSGNKVELK